MEDLVPIDGNDTKNISILNNDTLIQIAQMAEERVNAMNTIKLHALKSTNHNDWINEGGKPYLQESGSCKIARVFGVSYRIDSPLKQIFTDGHFEFIYTGEFSLGGSIITATGSRSSKSDFFTGRKDPKPPSEIDEGDVRKAAYTNCIGRGIKELLGLGNLTWEDLATAGIRKEDCQGFEFDKSGQEMNAEAQGHLKEMTDMLTEMAGGDNAKFSDLLEKFTSFKGRDNKEVPGKRTTRGMSEKSITVTHGKVKTAYEAWQKKQPKPQEQTPGPEPTPSTTQQRTEPETQLSTEEKKSEITRMINEIIEGTPWTFEDTLKDLSSYQNRNTNEMVQGPTSLQGLSDKYIAMIYAKTKASYVNYKEQTNG